MDKLGEKMDLRALEKSKKLGYLFYVKYDGTKFYSFDEIKGETSVKSFFRETMKNLGFDWAKGIQQAGRTDAKVSATENILYVSSNKFLDMDSLILKFNEISTYLKITSYFITLPNLILPDYIVEREYIYSPKLKKEFWNENEENIQVKCSKLSGTYDVSRFTSNTKLKEHIRTVDITLINHKLFFKGNSFMPHQVRIMSNYILFNELKEAPAKYLTLSKIHISQDLKDMIFRVVDIKVENVEIAYKSKDLYIFFTRDKGQLIGKRGSNIKKLKKIYGNIVIYDLV